MPIEIRAPIALPAGMSRWSTAPWHEAESARKKQRQIWAGRRGTSGPCQRTRRSDLMSW
jgi:hypothetical protein